MKLLLFKLGEHRKIGGWISDMSVELFVAVAFRLIQCKLRPYINNTAYQFWHIPASNQHGARAFL